MRREIKVVQVTANSVVHDIRVFTPGAGCDSGQAQKTLAEWKAAHPWRRPYVGLKFNL